MQIKSIKAAIYCRFTHPSGRFFESDTDLQRVQSARKVAIENGWMVTHVSRDYEKSPFEELPELERLRHLARSTPCPFQKLIIDEASSLSPSLRTFDRLVKEFAANGIDVIITNTTKFMRGSQISGEIRNLFDEYHSERTSLDVRRTMNLLVQEGYYPGGRLPLGYKSASSSKNGKRKKIVINEAEAKVVRRIFALACSFKSCLSALEIRSITHAVNSEGLTTRHGASFEPKDIRRILQNPIYVGRKVYLSHPKPGAGVETLWLSVPPIVGQKEFEQTKFQTDIRGQADRSSKMPH